MSTYLSDALGPGAKSDVEPAPGDAPSAASGGPGGTSDGGSSCPAACNAGDERPIVEAMVSPPPPRGSAARPREPKSSRSPGAPSRGDPNKGQVCYFDNDGMQGHVEEGREGGR